MTAFVQICTFNPQGWKLYKSLRLRALADAPDAFGSTLAEEEKRVDEEWAARLQAGTESGWDLPLVALADGRTAGLAWGRIAPPGSRTASLYQMWVAPEFRRLGVGHRLLEAVIAWCREKKVRFLDLGVNVGNSPAQHLYRRAGFVDVGDPQPLRPGSEQMAQAMRLVIMTQNA